MSELSDEELMHRYSQGDGQSFQILYKRYESRLYKFLWRRLNTKHRNMATDLFQMTWLKVHQAKKNFDASQKFSSWLFTIALNSLRDHLSEKRFEMEVELVEPNVSVNDRDAEISAMVRQQMTILEKLLECLPQIQREIILLIDGEGFQSKEVSTMLGISDGAVRQLLFRGRSKIMELSKGKL